MSGSGVSADQHKLFLSHQLFNKKTIDIPPRKLLTRRPNSLDCSGSPKAHPLPPSFDTLFQKFLPFNGGDDDDSDPYCSDHFRMFEFKVRRCTRSRSHDWTDCPFSHPGEKARRRDPRRYHYSGTVCSDYRRGGCSRGDNCEFAHGVFECWLHPARYRTEPCKDGKNCKRKVCFFAHSRKQLRVLPSHSQTNGNHCCVFSRSATSPTSTLMGMSPFSPRESPSPPLSPVNLKPPYSSLSRYNDIRSSTTTSLDSSNMSKFRHAMLSCCNKDVVAELIMSSLEAININEASGSESTTSWVDACFADEVEDHDHHQHFILSPSTQKAASASRHFFNGLIEDKISSENKNWDCPDLGWVNDLLM